MMEDGKTFLLYLFGLAGLITLSILFTGRIEPLEIESPPINPTPMIVVDQPTARPAQISQKACPTVSQKIMLYMPEMTIKDQHQVISGTVYASDFVTPLPDIQIDMWQSNREGQASPYFPPYHIFHERFPTDAAGHYEFTIQKSELYDIIQLHYRVRDQAHCPLTLQLLLVTEPNLTNTLLTLPPLGKPAGPLLRGPIDIVLPVPSLEP